MKKLLIFLICILICSNAYAKLPWDKYSYFSNYGGLNDNLSKLEIADNEATSIQNVVFDTGGAISKRYGYQNITSPGAAYAVVAGSSAITGIYYYKQYGGNNYIVACANVSSQLECFQKQYDASNNIPVGSWTRIDGGNLPTTYNNNQYVTFSQANNVLVITPQASNVTNPWAWQATGNIYTLTNSANVTPSTISVFHKNILFISGDPNNPSRVRYSDLTNGITVFNATDFFDLDKNNGQKVTALVSAYGNLYIFEDNSIWMLTGSSNADFSLQKMVDNVGTLSQQSISVINGHIFFVTKQNDIAIYDGNYSVQFLSSKIRNTIGGNNFNRASTAIGLGFSSYKYKDLDYYVAESLVGTNQNNSVLLYDTYRSAWTVFSGITPNAWAVVDSSNGQNIMIFGDNKGLIYFYPNIGTYHDVSNTCDVNNVCTTTSGSIYSFYQTKWFRYSDAALGNKYLRLLKTYISNSTLASYLTTTVKSDYSNSGNVYTYTFNPSGALWGVAKWGVDMWTGGGLNIDREEPNLGTQMFQILYSNNIVDQDMTILGWELFIEPTDTI
jgi:hypothetical protein